MRAIVSPNPSNPEALTGLIARARAADGQPPFSDQSLVEAGRGERALLVSESGSVLVGAAIVGPDEFELVIDPDARGAGDGAALVSRVLAEHPAATFAWAHGDHPASRALAARFGFEPVRTLLQLRAPVSDGSLRDGLRPPQGADRDSLPEEREARLEGNHQQYLEPFRPGVDDTAWLALNARAFAAHPEQGGLTQRDLDDRKAEPWFDPGDFLILRDGERMIGFCWLKVEEADDHEQVGEYYAVGIDPDRQGEGLGRVLMDAGFARLVERGIRTAALYVEADNEPALALYRRYGFAQHTIDVRYRRGSQ
ncbi:MAG: mycothiol synthase [Cryobacterium sp.]|nr:mycothiol synthase [Cryobacterium sp.]